MSVEGIRSKFPIKSILTIIGEPTYKAINEVQEALYKNAAAILATLRGGRNGRIGLIMDASVYANVSTTEYLRPTEPLPYAQHGPDNSAAARANANDIHKEERRIYDIKKT